MQNGIKFEAEHIKRESKLKSALQNFLLMDQASWKAKYPIHYRACLETGEELREYLDKIDNADERKKAIDEFDYEGRTPLHCMSLSFYLTAAASDGISNS